MINYPLKFEPILKDKIWGGEKLSQILNKNSDRKDIGESWEISDVENDTSVVVNGVLKGKTLKEIIALYKGDLVGNKVYEQFGENFPLLIKYIDAKEALSIQLHPNDALAKKRHNSFGKTEMWYVMQADKDANLQVGFKKEVSKEAYVKSVEDKTLVDILNFDVVDKGDVYFIPTGRIHAIGAGVLLAEIQQTSDVTYRIYDWDRTDDAGNSRDLHTEEAIDAIDYKVQDNYRTDYKSDVNKVNTIVDCNYFTTSVIPVTETIIANHSTKDSFVIYMCVSGAGVQLKSNDFDVQLNYGETVLVPASVKALELNPVGDSEILEVYIK